MGTTLNTLINTGFAIRHVEEWHPTPEQVAAHPDWAEELDRPLILLIAVIDYPVPRKAVWTLGQGRQHQMKIYTIGLTRFSASEQAVAFLTRQETEVAARAYAEAVIANDLRAELMEIRPAPPGPRRSDGGNS